MPLPSLTSNPSIQPHLQVSDASAPATRRFDNENSAQKVTLYFGNGGQSPDKTDLMSAIGAYVHRVANSNKNLDNYPLVFSDKSGMDAFNKLRDQFLANSPVERPRLTGRANHDIGSHFAYALRNVRAVMADEFEFSPNQKIYIVGHGSAGSDEIGVDDKILTMKDVSQELERIGVPKNIRDVRLTSCSSADSRKISTLKGENLSYYSEKFSENGYVRKAPAEHLLNEMSKAEFDEVTITGYHGAGVYWDGKEFPKSALRNANSPSSASYNPEDMVKRSTVSVKFDHGTSVDP
ncbi:hypothetical protein [Burkholderia ubonensis]|uniref:hypothetical protein n=1 Tax=Burkholderia ubonensis TaxID=101571 RepID=UPI000A5C971D|nr:hypothetical protein [Burkholderia ubonensis]